MTELRWLEIWRKALDNIYHKVGAAKFSPETWPERRKTYMEYIAEVDAATEVFNMESAKKPE